ncbi:MAG: hypothetical protein QOH04_2502 [Sphingomonadales bacterium]|jgi:hypothetical protein|nr:hypothetical protein [Sphingomonadales bacterium]MEA3036730.1 hypothetical protein [Sphingomonadales bacterium]
MIIAQNDSVYDNYGNLTGGPAVRVTGTAATATTF